MDLLVPTHQDLVGAAARTAVLAFEDGAGGDDGARRTVDGGIELIHGAGAARHAGADMPEADGSWLRRTDPFGRARVACGIRRRILPASDFPATSYLPTRLPRQYCRR